ncbi:MAG: cation:dicarboxylase symporter family transporter [Pseudomonadota bacterium]
MWSQIAKVKLPLILLAEVIFCLTLGDLVPENIKAFLYSLSLAMKDILLFVLPAIIFSFVVSSLSDLKQGALSFVILLFSMICLSNFTSTCLSGFLGSLVFNNLAIIPNVQTSAVELQPLWQLALPKLIPNEAALGAGLVLGLAFSFVAWKPGRNLAQASQRFSIAVLNKVFIPVIPIFLVGFLLKLQHDQLLALICKNYLSIFLMISVFLVVYLVLTYGFASNFHLKKWGASLRNMLPAALAGFSSMSSAAAMPLTILGSEQNCDNKSLARGVVPITTNIHLVGDCIGIPIMALAILLSFGGTLPSASEYIVFAGFFVLAKFAVAAVPGGGILVMLPILEQHLGFSGEMLSLITMLYMMFDPVLTSSNVMGNGGFAMVIAKIVSGKRVRARVGVEE